MLAPNDYTVVFDLMDVGFQNWMFPAAGLGIAVFAIGALVAQKDNLRDTPGRKAYRTTIALIVAVFGVVWGLFVGLGQYGDYTTLRDQYAAGRFETAQGCVEHFRGLEKVETFDVAGHHFEYSDYVMTPGFKHMKIKGGPVSATAWVRIRYIGGDIVRLEVARTPCSPVAGFVDGA